MCGVEVGVLWRMMGESRHKAESCQSLGLLCSELTFTLSQHDPYKHTKQSDPRVFVDTADKVDHAQPEKQCPFSACCLMVKGGRKKELVI